MKPLKIQNCMSSTDIQNKRTGKRGEQVLCQTEETRPMASFLNLGFMESF
ncbi:MAG: hypothetical protein IPG55_13270 [Saprospiraceae bacterium]|nr:hypothetical protein [Candidatus Defluviibacterium haderslevense]